MDFGADKSFGVVNVATKNLEEENSHLVQNLFLHLSVIHHLRAERKIISVTKVSFRYSPGLSRAEKNLTGFILSY